MISTIRNRPEGFIPFLGLSIVGEPSKGGSHVHGRGTAAPCPPKRASTSTLDSPPLPVPAALRFIMRLLASLRRASSGPGTELERRRHCEACGISNRRKTDDSTSSVIQTGSALEILRCATVRPATRQANMCTGDAIDLDETSRSKWIVVGMLVGSWTGVFVIAWKLSSTVWDELDHWSLASSTLARSTVL